MDLCTCTVRHNGNLGMTIEKGEHNAVTPAEIVVLRHIHGHDAVVNVQFNRQTNRSNMNELDRLKRFFGEAVVAECFPGARPQLPSTLAEARLAEDEPPELPEDDEAADLPPPPADVLARARGARAARSASDLTG